MKRFVLFFLVLCFILLSLSSCQFIGNSIGRLVAPLSEFIPIRKQANEAKLDISQKIVDYFNKKDLDGLKEIFCQKTQGISDIREQIQAAFEFINGNIVSYNHTLEAAGEGQSREKGETVKFDNGWIINDIRTDTDKVYKIFVHMFLLDTDKNREGVSYLCITDSDGMECLIGYQWTTYDYEGSTLAHQAIQAISDKNLDALKSLLCAKALENNDIENQIQAGFQFFEGKATFGEVKNKPGVFDGNHDFHAVVTDEEIIENHEPVRTYISVFCENIETDINKTYQLDLYAYLLYADDKAYEGISQIILRYGADECVIGENIK